MTRRKLEKTFGLIHYCILEIGLVGLLLLGLWHIFQGVLTSLFSSKYDVPPIFSPAIIAWGIGGLLVKTLLVEGAYPQTVPALRLVVLIGTPGRKGPHFPGRFLGVLLKGFDWGGVRGFKTDELGSAWEAFVRNKGIRVVYIVGADDSMAPYSAADQWDSRNVFIIPETHKSLTSGAAIRSPDSSLSRILGKVLLEEARGPQTTPALL